MQRSQHVDVAIVTGSRSPCCRQQQQNCSSRTFKTEIGNLMSAFICRTFWPKMAVFGGKIGEGMVQCWPLMNFLLLGIVTSVPFLAQIAQDMRTWKCGQADRHTLWQRWTEFIICPVLYAIAVGQNIESEGRLRLTSSHVCYKNC